LGKCKDLKVKCFSLVSVLCCVFATLLRKPSLSNVSLLVLSFIQSKHATASLFLVPESMFCNDIIEIVNTALVADWDALLPHFLPDCSISTVLINLAFSCTSYEKHSDGRFQSDL
jgi:hypothetical protein